MNTLNLIYEIFYGIGQFLSGGPFSIIFGMILLVFALKVIKILIS